MGVHKGTVEEVLSGFEMVEFKECPFPLLSETRFAGERGLVLPCWPSHWQREYPPGAEQAHSVSQRLLRFVFSVPAIFQASFTYLIS